MTLAAAILAGIFVWAAANGAVPADSGERTVPGLHAPVEILFDRWGVPHVYARDSDDAWFAAGYLQARERLWTMELYRRAAAGRLSELFGERTLAADRRFRALALRRAAATEWASASADTRTALERHAAGVNAAMAQMTWWTRPVEFRLMGITPEPWTPVDALSIAKLMAWRLAENRHAELVRGALARTIGAGEANRLMGAWPPWAPSILATAAATNTGRARASIVQHPGLEATVQHRGLEADGRDARNAGVDPAGPARGVTPDLPAGLGWLALTSRAAASNSWVVDGSRTASGHPLLANDPHLNLEMPSIWYELHLVAADLQVSGATIPGTPFVVIGHNQAIAWGVTNSGADVQDFYAEDVNFATGKYLYRGAWEPLSIEPVEIDVRGAASPDRFAIYRTRHGPLVATENEWEDPPVFGPTTPRGGAKPLALRWEAVALGETAGAFLAIDRARTWTEFVDGVRRLGGTSQNFVYADADGNIGYALSGALPIRVNGDGSAPVPGWTGEYEWAGRVSPDRLPAVLNPPSHAIVAANGEIDGGSLETRDWAAPFRTARIASLLGDRRGFDQQAFEQIQLDTYGEAANVIVNAVEAASRSRALRTADAPARTAIERLRLWDRRVDGRPVVTLFHAFERALWRRTFGDELAGPMFQQLFEYGLDERYSGIYAILDDPSSRWWDDIATIDRRETRDDIVVLAAGDAIRGLRAKFGDEQNWRWERVHAARFGHALGAGGFVLDWFFSRGPVSVSGDSSTVNKTSIDRRRPYGVTDLASYRQIVEPGAWDRTLAVNTTGQSGHARSVHYFDQNALWARGEYRTMPFSRRAVEQAQASRLLLVP